MADEEVKTPVEDGADVDIDQGRASRSFFTRRNALILSGLLAVLLVLVGLLSVVTYRYGVFDPYIKAQFVAKMAEIGIDFDATEFRVTVNPLALELSQATFNDRVSGEKLFYIESARLEMSVADLYAWQLTRDIVIDKTAIRGAQVWVNFDEEGRSNFDNLKLIEDEAGGRVNFKYDSAEFSIEDSVVYFGDAARRISGTAKNVRFTLAPEDRTVAADQRRYKFDLFSTDSDFVYQDRTVEDIDLRVSGIADRLGAEITSLELKTPIGESTLVGTLTDWAAPKYNFDIQSTVDLTQASSILPLGTSLVGVANFRGKVVGEGENYRIEGTADTASLSAEGVSLKGVNVEAAVSGTGSNYEANGTAIAELLTFEDFRIDLLKLAGNVRGSGTDFRWVGELQAAAAKTESLSLGGLFLSDALAEVKDRELTAQAGNGRAKRFAVGDRVFNDFAARNLRFSYRNGTVDLTTPSAQARSFTTPDFSLGGVTGADVRVRDRDGRTDVTASRLRAQTAKVDKGILRNVSADDFKLVDSPSSTELSARNLRADQLNAEGTVVSGIEAPTVSVRDTGAETIIYSDRLRVAKVDTGAARLGTLNIAGVRLSIRRGRIEGRSQDIDAGTVTLARSATLRDGGSLENVKISRPIFVLEDSGRYRATADMTIGGGAVGSINLGAASASVDVNNDRAALNNLTATVMDGEFTGNASIALTGRGQSLARGNFANLDIAKLLALQTGRIVPLEGQTTGDVDLSFRGTDLGTANGTLNAAITANAGTAGRGFVPVNGEVRLSAVDGLFNVDKGNLTTGNSTVNATGRFDLRGSDSNLDVSLASTDAGEVDRLVRVLGLSDELERQLDSLEVTAGGDLNFTGKITGNLSDPIVNGKASLASLNLRGQDIGSVSTDIVRTADDFQLLNGKLVDRTGGNAGFKIKVPAAGSNNIEVEADLTNINAANLLAVIPFDLPARLRDFTGQTSGSIRLTGLPDNAEGEMNLAAERGVIAGQPFDGLRVKAVFAGTRVDLQTAEIRIGNGHLTATGFLDRASQQFDLNIGAKSLPVPLLIALAPANPSIPVVSGDVDFTAKASGYFDRSETYDVTFAGVAPNVQVDQTALGQVTFEGRTVNQTLTANLTANIGGSPQIIDATVNFGDQNLPFTVATNFNQSPLAPFLAFIPQTKDLPIAGTATGRIELAGNFSRVVNGTREYGTGALTGTAAFSLLNLQIQDTPLTAAEPVLIRFNDSEIVFEQARFTGGGSNVTVTGTKALTADGSNNLNISGRINLNLLNLAVTDTFFAGFADTEIRFVGPNSTARLTGTANIVNGSVATFLGSDRFTINRLQARVLFNTDQVEIREATGYLGGGRFTGSGGGVLEGLAIQNFRFSLDGTGVTVPLPKDFVTTGDARLEISGVRLGGDLQVTIAGRVFARRSIYSKDIDLASLISGRSDASLAGGGGGGTSALRFDLVIEGRDALIVRNNIADLTASVSLAVTGDANDPQIAGRITATNGTILFRKDRYIVERGVLEFPPDTGVEPIINLQAESEIAGYQVFVNLSGPLKDSELLTATVRSNPALPQADVVSLITTGNLTNTAGGIPTLAQTGINTAAEILTDAIINNPARKATDRLFGLNVFEIDPLISGQQANPGARLTVGRQINNNLRVTYSTNLSQDQNQVLALEYRVSNRLSLIAQYEQRSLSNVTRNRDNFSFEVRFRKRF